MAVRLAEACKQARHKKAASNEAAFNRIEIRLLVSHTRSIFDHDIGCQQINPYRQVESC